MGRCRGAKIEEEGDGEDKEHGKADAEKKDADKKANDSKQKQQRANSKMLRKVLKGFTGM